MQEQIKNQIDTVISNLNQLPSIPEVATRIINMVNDPEVSFKHVAEEISRDQSMTTNILKLSNSAFFSKGKEITSIDRAIVTLGLKEVKNIVLLVAAKPLLEKPIIGYDLGQGMLWQQGLAVATISRNIAMLKKRKDIADVVFTGGIIHNIGKVVIAIFVNRVYKEILNTVETKRLPFHLAEREIMGYDHQEVGEKILDKWKFPPVLKSVVRFYREPEKAPDAHKLEVAIVHVASHLGLMAGIGLGSDGLYFELSSSAIKTIGLTDHEMMNFFSSVPEVLKEIKVLQ